MKVCFYIYFVLNSYYFNKPGVYFNMFYYKEGFFLDFTIQLHICVLAYISIKEINMLLKIAYQLLTISSSHD